jgi:hypothetical protein
LLAADEEYNADEVALALVESLARVEPEAARPVVFLHLQILLTAPAAQLLISPHRIVNLRQRCTRLEVKYQFLLSSAFAGTSNRSLIADAGTIEPSVYVMAGFSCCLAAAENKRPHPAGDRQPVRRSIC